MAFADTAELAVRINLTGNASAGISKLQRQVNGLGSSLGRTGKGVGQIGAGFAKAGLVIGGAAVTGLAAAAKTAIDFQDAFAGVRKTVEGSPKELEALNQQLRQLSTRIPVDFSDIASIAQEAGALGVAKENVAGFTEVVARLSAATVGLTADAAAEAFGKLGNVLHIKTVKGFEELGSALVALGNAGASSEGDIVEVAKRFGAAGAQAELSAAQVLGFSSAIASMGVEPEAAGSSLSRLFNNITKYLGTGNKKAKAFAKVNHQTVAQFKKDFAHDASGAVQTFLTNLSKLDRFTASRVLKEAGITNVRDINAVLLLARGHEELTRQVKLSEKAYKDNTELQRVSEERFKTLKNRIIEFKNAIKLAGVTLAEGFLPALGRTVEKLQKFLAEPGNQASLKSIGEDIGKGIDSIDWNAVLDGARKLFSTLKDALTVAKLMFDAFNKLPGPLKDAAASFLVLNKLSGGLIGTGAANVVGGLGETIARSAGSRLPGIGKLFAQPVFVTNWPIGFGGPGGLPTAAPPGTTGAITPAIGAGIFLPSGYIEKKWDEFKTHLYPPVMDSPLGKLAPNTDRQLDSPALRSAAASLKGIASGILTHPRMAPTLHAPEVNRGAMEANHWRDLAKVFGDAAFKANIEDRRPGVQDSPLGKQTLAGIDRVDTSVSSGLSNLQLAVGTGDATIHQAVSAKGDAVVGATYSSADRIVSAIWAARPIVNVTNITKTTTIQNRYGPANGSYGQGTGTPYHPT